MYRIMKGIKRIDSEYYLYRTQEEQRGYSKKQNKICLNDINKHTSPYRCTENLNDLERDKYKPIFMKLKTNLTI